MSLSFYDHENGKCRVAMCLVYPDSAPSDWLNRLANWHIRCAVSPLHDHDTYDSDKYMPVLDADTGEIVQGQLVHAKGDIKKAHYHVLVQWNNSTTYGSFKKIFDDIGGVVPPWDHLEVVDPVAMFRYFTHKDDPDKYQYSESDIIVMGGFDPYKFENTLEKVKHITEVIELLDSELYLRNYTDLLKYTSKHDPVLCSYIGHNTLMIKQLFKDRKEIESNEYRRVAKLVID